MTLPDYDLKGAKAGSCSVASEVFGLKKTNANLLKAAYEHYLASRRVNLAKAKTRGVVSGGGRKPWRQKGTGRARVGSIRSPIWRGGGIVFGPTGLENYATKLNKKAKALALKHALTLKSGQAVCLRDLPEDGKTATIAALIKAIGLKRRVLFVAHRPPAAVQRAARNLPELHLIEADYLNVFRVLNADWLLFSADGLERLQERLSAPVLKKG